MAWIESHTVLLRHRKLIELAREARIKPVYVLGHLHSLWHNALEQREDGDLSSWSEDFLARSCAWRGDGHQWVSLLQTHGWLNGRLIHDWLDYAGPYLRSKYGGGSNSHGKETLKRIWELHGKDYGSEKRVESEWKAPLPNLTLPNLRLGKEPRMKSVDNSVDNSVDKSESTTEMVVDKSVDNSKCAYKYPGRSTADCDEPAENGARLCQFHIEKCKDLKRRK